MPTGQQTAFDLGRSIMSSWAISLIVFGIVFSAALVGMAVRAALPERYRDSESKEVVKLAMGMIGTLSALVLGLVVATAKEVLHPDS